MRVWLNGDWVDEARIPLADRGLTLGDGLFETLLIRGGQPVFFADHIDRLRASARQLGLPVPFDDAAIRDALGVLDADRVGGDRLFSARITLTRGVGPRGIVPPSPDETKPVMAISGAPAALPADAPMTCHIAGIRRNEGSPVSRMKTLSYIDNVLARQEAAATGADEAIMLNNAGEVACASVGNVFVIRDGALVTPPVASGVLPGIVRKQIMILAGESGIEASECRLAPADLETYPFFLTNSLIGLRPAMLAGAPPPVMPALFSTLQQAYDRRIAAETGKGAGAV